MFNARLQKTDAIIAIYILIAFIMLIVPLPSFLLDVFMAFNMAVSFTILFVCMFTREVLEISFFPTILLFTTIFRIAMNVSSTRYILTTGTSGNVVKTFGAFVGGGDLIVGAIIFIILIRIRLAPVVEHSRVTTDRLFKGRFSKEFLDAHDPLIRVFKYSNNCNFFIIA